MAAPAKFLFNADFAQDANPAQRPISPAEHVARLSEAEADGYRKGFAAAEAEVGAQTKRRNAAALESIAAGTEALAATLVTIEAKLEAEAVEVAVAVARKLAGGLLAREPMCEIENLAKDCLKQLVSTPHVVVRVNGAQHEFARNEIAEIARTRGFEGRLVVLAETDVGPGDCRIEWADGGVRRDRAATDAVIGDLVERYLAARRPAAGDSTLDSKGASQGEPDERK